MILMMCLLSAPPPPNPTQATTWRRTRIPRRKVTRPPPTPSVSVSSNVSAILKNGNLVPRGDGKVIIEGEQRQGVEEQPKGRQHVPDVVVVVKVQQAAFLRAGWWFRRRRRRRWLCDMGGMRRSPEQGASSCLPSSFPSRRPAFPQSCSLEIGRLRGRKGGCLGGHFSELDDPRRGA